MFNAASPGIAALNKALEDGPSEPYSAGAGGKVSRQRRTRARASFPYARPTSGRHAAPGPSAAQIVTAEKTVQKVSGREGDGLEGIAEGVHRRGWGFGLSKLWGLATGTVHLASTLLRGRPNNNVEATGAEVGPSGSSLVSRLTGMGTEVLSDEEEFQDASPNLRGSKPERVLGNVVQNHEPPLAVSNHMVGAVFKGDSGRKGSPGSAQVGQGQGIRKQPITFDEAAGAVARKAGEMKERNKMPSQWGTQNTPGVAGGHEEEPDMAGRGPVWQEDLAGMYQTPATKSVAAPPASSPQESAEHIATIARQFMNSQARVSILTGERSPEKLDTQVPYTLSGRSGGWTPYRSVRAEVNGEEGRRGSGLGTSFAQEGAYRTPGRLGLARTPYRRPYHSAQRLPYDGELPLRRNAEAEAGILSSAGGPLRRTRLRTQANVLPYRRTPGTVAGPLGRAEARDSTRAAYAGGLTAAASRQPGQSMLSRGSVDGRPKEDSTAAPFVANDWARKIMASLDSMTPPKITRPAEDDLPQLPMSERVQRSMKLLEPPPPVETLPSGSGPLCSLPLLPEQAFPPTTPAHFRAASLAVERVAKTTMEKEPSTLRLETTTVEVAARRASTAEAGPSTSGAQTHSPPTSSFLPFPSSGAQSASLFASPPAPQTGSPKAARPAESGAASFSFGAPTGSSAKSSGPLVGGPPSSSPLIGGGPIIGDSTAAKEQSAQQRVPEGPSAKKRSFRMSANFEDEGASEEEKEKAPGGLPLFGAASSLTSAGQGSTPSTSTPSFLFSSAVKKGESFADLQEAAAKKLKEGEGPTFQFYKEKKDVSFSSLASAPSEPPPTSKLGGFTSPTTPSSIAQSASAAPPSLFPAQTAQAPALTAAPSTSSAPPSLFSMHTTTSAPLFFGAPRPAEDRDATKATPAIPLAASGASAGAPGGGLLGFLKARDKADDGTASAQPPAEKAPASKPAETPAPAPAPAALFGAVAIPPPGGSQPASTPATSPFVLPSFEAGAPSTTLSPPPVGLFLPAGPAGTEGPQKVDTEEPAAKKPTPAFTFGATAPAVAGGFGSGAAATSAATPLFGAPSKGAATPGFSFAAGALAPAFGAGKSTPAAATAQAPASGLFTFGASAAASSAPATAPSPFGGAPATTPVFGTTTAPATTPAFGSTAASASAPAFGSTTTPGSAPAFGTATAASAAAPAAFAFGAGPKPTTAPAPSIFNFGATQAAPSTPAGSSFVFGQPSTAATASTFAFGNTSTPGSAPASTPFTFGAPPASSAAAAAAPFSFGAAAKPPATPGFGSGFGAPAFGNGGNSMMGSPGAMEDTMTEEPAGVQPAAAPAGGFAFGGQPAQALAPVPFGGPAAAAPVPAGGASFPFGAAPTQPAQGGFGSGLQPAFSMGAGDNVTKGRVVRKAKRPAGGRR